MAFNGYINLPSIINYTNCYKTLLNAEKLYLKEAEMINKSIDDGTWRNNFIYWKWFGTSQTGGVSYKYIKYSNNIAGSLDSKYSIGLSNDTSYAGINVSGYPGKGNLSYTYKNSAGSYDITLAMKEINLVINPAIDSNVSIIDGEKDFEWVAWATKEKAKLDNFKKGYDLKFWTTGKKMSSSAVILGGTLGFSVSGVNYTLDDIIKGTLSKEALGKTFAEGIKKCKGIWLRIGGILGAILESSIVKTIAGAFTVGGIFYVSYAIFNKLMDYTQSLTGSMDDVSYPGWWTQGTTYTEDSTTGSGMAVVPSTNTGAIDNWENYTYTNTDANGNVGTGATETGTTVNQGNSNLGTVTLATGATVALGIATGTSIPLTVPETTKVGLNILEGQAITLDLDAVESMTPLPIQPVEWNNVPPPWMVNPIELHLSDNLSNWTVPNIKIDTPVIPPVTVPDVNVKVDVNVPDIKVTAPVIPNIKIDTPVLPNIQIDSSAITLTVPESIPLTAPTEGVDMIFDTTSMEAIKAISDTYKTYAEKVEARENERVTREETKETRDSERWEKEKELVQNEIDNKVTNNEILAVQHSLYTTKAEGLNYAERSIRAWVNEHSQVEYTTKEGVPLKEGYYSNPQLNQQKDYNNALESESRIKAKNDLASVIQADLQADQKARSEKKIYGFKDINPSSRADIYGFIKNIFIKKE